MWKAACSGSEASVCPKYKPGNQIAQHTISSQPAVVPQINENSDPSSAIVVANPNAKSPGSTTVPNVP